MGFYYSPWQYILFWKVWGPTCQKFWICLFSGHIRPEIGHRNFCIFFKNRCFWLSWSVEIGRDGRFRPKSRNSLFGHIFDGTKKIVEKNCVRSPNLAFKVFFEIFLPKYAFLGFFGVFRRFVPILAYFGQKTAFNAEYKRNAPGVFWKKIFGHWKYYFFSPKKFSRCNAQLQRQIWHSKSIFLINFWLHFGLKWTATLKPSACTHAFFSKNFGNDSETYIFLPKKFSCHYIQQKKRCEQPKFTHYFTIFSPFGIRKRWSDFEIFQRCIFGSQMMKEWWNNGWTLIAHIFFSVVYNDTKFFLARKYIFQNRSQKFLKKTRECKRLVLALQFILSQNEAKNGWKKLTLNAKFGVAIERCTFKIFLGRKNNIFNDQKNLLKKRTIRYAYIQRWRLFFAQNRLK